MNPDRRDFGLRIAAGVVAVLAPICASAASPRHVVHVGRFGEALDDLRKANLDRFRRHGFHQGTNLKYEVIDTNLQDGKEFDALVQQVIGRRPALILASSDWRALAFKKATREIPIVFHSVSDPIESGLVESLNSPGGNVTGASSMDRDLAAKRLETLLELAPKAKRIAWCSIQDAVGATHFAQIAAASVGRGLDVVRVEVPLGTSETDFLRAVDAVGPDAVIVPTVHPRGPVPRHLMRKGVPAMYSDNRVVEAGGLVSLGERRQDRALRAIDAAVLVLRGRTPASIPVDQLAAVHLAVNLKTAEAMSLQVPRSILVRANQVIQ